MKLTKIMAQKNNIWIWVVVGLFAYFAFTGGFSGLGSNAPAGGTGSQGSSGAPYISTGATTLSLVQTDAQSQGTAVSGTSYISQNQASFVTGVTSSSPGTKLDILLQNGSNYHSAYVTGLTVPQSPTMVIPLSFNRNATVTEVVAYPYSGQNLNNNGGVNNITNAGANGASYTLQDTMYGTSLQSTQDMTCLIELTDGVNATSSPAGISYSGNGVTATGTSAPAWYAVAGGNSRVWTFDQAALTSPSGITNTITASALSTKSFSAGTKLIKSCYTKEWFIDPNTGKATYAVADSNNAVKSIAKYTFTGFFQ